MTPLKQAPLALIIIIPLLNAAPARAVQFFSDIPESLRTTEVKAIKDLSFKSFEGAGFVHDNLKKCLCVNAPDPTKPDTCETNFPSDSSLMAAVPFDCQPKELPINEALWNDHLFNAAGEELTGIYALNGQRCATRTSPNQACPVVVRAFYEITCPVSQAKDGVCPMADMVAAHYSIRHLVNTNLVPELKAVKPKAVEIGTDQIFARQNNRFTCLDVTETVNGVTKTFKQVVTGLDQFGNVVCAIDPSARALDAITGKMCDVEIAAAQGTGGLTTSPTCPNEKSVVEVKLVGLNHNVDECVAGVSGVGNGVVTNQQGAELTISRSAPSTTQPAQLTIGGTLVTAANINTFNKQLFCHFSVPSCPTGWRQFESWTKTKSTACKGVVAESLCPLACDAFGAADSFPSCFNADSGSHPFANQVPETSPFCDAKRDVLCKCIQGTGHTCRAEVKHVGCN